MRSGKKNNDNNKKSIFCRALALVYIIVVAVFMVAIVKLDILPMEYLGILAAVILVISILLFVALWKKSEKKKILAPFAALAMIVVLAVGIAYLSGTLSFFNNISEDTNMQNFYVVVRNDGAYEDIEDIENETVGLMLQTSDAYTEAQEKLQNKVQVELEKVGNYDVLAESLIGGDYEAIFLNSAYYEMAIEEVDGFTTDSTKILAEIAVAVESGVETKSVNVTEDSFNMYISGIDTSGSIGNISRSDVNMILTVNPRTKTVLLTSIPRDYYVKLGTIGEYDKLTHSGLYGIEETIATIENLFAIDINYYARVNFTTVINLVDALGGITVNSDYSFYADGNYYSYGENYLNGEEALAFARERYSFADGDVQRVKNQQAVISGIINKATGSTAILTGYSSILSSLENNFQTSLSQKEITALVKMQLDDMSGWDIQRQNVVGTGDMLPVYSAPNSYVYVMHPDQDSVVAATQEIQRVLKQ